LEDNLANPRPLEDRVAVITGAGGVLGLATAKLFAERGAKVVCVVRREVDIARLGAAVPAAMVLQADVSKEDEVRAYVAETLRQLRRIDIFFTNAGIEGRQAPIADLSAADFMRVMEVNVLGVFLGLKHVMPVMAGQGSGAIVNTGSIASSIGGAKVSAYIASKHAVLGLTRSAALEAAPHGVRVNMISPGYIDSRMLSDIAARLGGDTAGLVQRVPDGRLGTPEEVARAVAFLASDDSRYMNGANLVLDGGRTVG
jgi:meso-butanediol dehydrogenase / (S,S)-butanediol dehydrogenase / diacetyl reductase